LANAFDRVRYPSYVFAITHPATIGVFAALFGRPFAPFGASRVLEIGCGEGVNLINMALGAPEAEFVGVDLAGDPIARARATAKDCGAANVSFHVRDLVELDASFGRFDYILAHGVYAWVPAPVRQALLRVVGERLSREGVALISYNVNPGSRLRQALRDMLLYVTKDVEDTEEKLRAARSFLEQQAEDWLETADDDKAMRMEARRVLEHAPEVVFHDELAETYAPQMLSDVVDAAAQFGLAYLCDAQPNLSVQALFPSEVFAGIRDRAGGDWVRFEQLLDFQTLNRFRYSLFCPPGGVDRRREAKRLRGLWASGDLKVVNPDAAAPDGALFEAGRTKLRTNDPPLARFLARLADIFPLSEPLDLASETPDLADHILRLWGREAIQLQTAPPPIVSPPGERPRAATLARVQAANGESHLATLRHCVFRIDDAPLRSIIPLIDGGRTREELAHEVEKRLDVPAAEASARLDEMLTKFARAGLIAG
jgi:SAM-dependent methyltransferase